jgi:PHD/YefM family antitoxin component YafN of YafNO toxin-antitoxin module
MRSSKEGFAMANSSVPNTSAEKNAQKYFKKAEQSDTLAKQSRKKERSAVAANTAKLRSLRLAKEESDKQQAEKAAAEQVANGAAAPHPAKARRARTTKRPAMKRMIY